MSIIPGVNPHTPIWRVSPWVEFCHPGYYDEWRVLLRLPITGQTRKLHRNVDPPTGLHYKDAVAACSAIAANRPGILLTVRLTQSEFSVHVRTHPECLTPDLDQPLTEDLYWFYPLEWNKDPTPEYPVCPESRFGGLVDRVRQAASWFSL